MSGPAPAPRPRARGAPRRARALADGARREPRLTARRTAASSRFCAAQVCMAEHSPPRMRAVAASCSSLGASTDMHPQAESSTLTPCASATASAGEAGGCNQGGPRRTVNAAPAHHEGHQFLGARQEGSTCRGAMSAGAKRRNINHSGPGALPAQSYHRTANPPHLRSRGQRRSRLSSIAMGAPMPHALRRRDCSTPCGVFCG